LRGTIAQVGGKKELIGYTDLDIAISNQCGRLLANIVIAYNSILLSKLLTRYTASGNQKALKRIKRISPVAWQHIYFLGHYTLRAFPVPLIPKPQTPKSLAYDFFRFLRRPQTRLYVSIHAPVKSATTYLASYFQHQQGFNPRAREERDD
jgi:hypothetical protein